MKVIKQKNLETVAAKILRFQSKNRRARIAKRLANKRYFLKNLYN